MPAESGLGEAAEQVGGKAQGGAIMGGDPAGRSRSGLDFMQRPGQQPAFGQQGIDGRQAQWHGRVPGTLDAVRALEPADLLSQARRNARHGVIGGRSKGAWGNDRHRPLWENVLFLFYSWGTAESTA